MAAIPPRDEIWFRKIYADLVKARRVTTIFRPGKRLEDDPKGFREGETLQIRIIDNVGADWANLYGEVVKDFVMPVRVVAITARPLGSFTPEDFSGSTPDVYSKESLFYQLGILYNFSPAEIGDDTLITRTRFEYL
jgi:hypothetical protein